MRKILLSAAFLLNGFLLSYGQNSVSMWTGANESSLTKGSKNVFEKNYKPRVYKVFQLNESLMRSALSKAPSIQKVSAHKSDFIISVPNSDGILERFRAVEFSSMAPELSAKYPGIKSYTGQGIDEPSSTIRFDINPQGFHAMILSSKRKTIYINPVDNDNKLYIVFDRDHLSDKKEIFDCRVEAVTGSAIQGIPLADAVNANADDGKLRTFRLALCVTGEFSVAALNGAGGTDAQKKAIVLGVLNTDLTRANGIFEKDFGIHMNFVANEDQIIYLVASTDPWTGSSQWNSKTQTTCDGVIGSANYDIGHLLAHVNTTGSNNGNAGCIGCVCKAGSKGSGFSAHTDVTGDPLVVDYWTHEMGHQFGANHTFTFSNESTAAQMEPGSGSTIMGYAGITGATDLQPHSDDYFHAISIEQVTDYIKSGTGGGACAVVTVTGDNTPTANAGADYIIPKSTPFKLTGTGSDADAADVLSYCWEEMDDYGTNSNSNTYPSSTTTKGPLFRSYLPGASQDRTFPRLSSILDGTNGYQWEVLPSVARTMNFRLTVKDNHPGGGNNNSDDMIVTVSSAAGPFAVTQPNTNLTWAAGSQQTITWNVASTNAAPVSCANVNILLSTDGGQTFPFVLASGTPNDGSQLVTLPANQSTTCRVKVEAAGNIFFDISNTNFTIGAAAPCNTPSALSSSAITSNSAIISWGSVIGGNSYDADYKLTSSGIWTNAATATAATTVNLSDLIPSTSYDWRVRTNCNGGSSAYTTTQNFTTLSGSCNDVYEPNDTKGKAVAIPLNTNINGLISTGTDKDFFKFSTTAGAPNIRITLTNLPADYDVKLFDPSGTNVAIAKKKGTLDETITYNGGPTGTYKVLVYGKQGANNPANCYTLQVQTGSSTFKGSMEEKYAADSKVGGYILVYPQPANSFTNIQFTNEWKGATTLTVFNQLGMAVITKQVNAESKTYKLDVSRLGSGMYYLKITNNNEIVTKKIIIQR